MLRLAHLLFKLQLQVPLILAQVPLMFAELVLLKLQSQLPVRLQRGDVVLVLIQQVLHLLLVDLLLRTPRGGVPREQVRPIAAAATRVRRSIPHTPNVGATSDKAPLVRTHVQGAELQDALSPHVRVTYLDFHLVPLLHLLHLPVLVAQLRPPVLQVLLCNLPESIDLILQSPLQQGSV